MNQEAAQKEQEIIDIIADHVNANGKISINKSVVNKIAALFVSNIPPGKEKPFITANVRDIIQQYYVPNGEQAVSFSRMVELLNEVAFKWHEAVVSTPPEHPKDAAHWQKVFNENADRNLSYNQSRPDRVMSKDKFVELMLSLPHPATG